LRLDEPRRKAVVVVLLFAFPIAYGGIGQLLGQDTSWDLRNYHYADPYWLLANHMKDVMPAQLQTYYSPVLDIPFYFAVNHFTPRVTGFLLALVQGSSFPILYFIGRRFTIRRLVALGLAALGMLTAGALGELGTIMGDTLTAPFFLGAILLGLRAQGRDPGSEIRAGSGAMHSVGPVFIACAIAGVGTGLKLSGLPIGLGIVCAFPLTTKGVALRITKGLAAAGGLVVGLALSYGWWGYELAERYSNPILPYMNQFFHSLYAPWASNTDTTALPHGILEILFYPFVWTLDSRRVGNYFVELSLVFLELLLLTLFLSSAIRAVRDRERFRLFDTVGQRFLITTVVVSYFVWAVEFGMYRYFIPIEMLSFVAILVCLQALRSRIPIREFEQFGNQLAIGTLVGIVVMSVAFEVPQSWGRSAWSQHYFSASIPSRLTTEPSAFLMLGGNPDGYIVPLFPTDDFFAQVQGNLPPTPFVEKAISKTVAGYRRVYIIWSDPPPKHISPLVLRLSDAKTARSYGFLVDWTSCVDLPADVGAKAHELHVCQLTSA
jgi:hypothetical protein